MMRFHPSGRASPVLACSPVAALLAACGLLVACGGGGDDACDTFPATPVDVTVLDPAGEPVEGAPVELDGVACTEDGAGAYSCEVLADGAGQLSIIDGRYNAHSEFLELPEPTCEPAPFAITVTLDAMMGA